MPVPDASVRGWEAASESGRGREVYLSLLPFSIFLGGILLGDTGVTGLVENDDLLPLGFQAMGRPALKSP